MVGMFLMASQEALMSLFKNGNQNRLMQGPSGKHRKEVMAFALATHDWIYNNPKSCADKSTYPNGLDCRLIAVTSRIQILDSARWRIRLWTNVISIPEVGIFRPPGKHWLWWQDCSPNLSVSFLVNGQNIFGWHHKITHLASYRNEKQNRLVHCPRAGTETRAWRSPLVGAMGFTITPKVVKII